MAKREPPNLAIAEITLHIVYNPAGRRPEQWDWETLLDLGYEETVEIVKNEELGSYDGIVDNAADELERR